LPEVLGDRVHALLADVERWASQRVSVDDGRRRVTETPGEVRQLTEASGQSVEPVVAEPEHVETGQRADGVGQSLQLVEGQQKRLDLAQLRHAVRQLEHLVVAEVQESQTGQLQQRIRKPLKPAFRQLLRTQNAQTPIIYGYIHLGNARISTYKSNRARQLYKNISMLFLFPVKDCKLSTGVNATFDASCYG